MAKYRTALPQLKESTFLTDGGLETTLIFNQGIDLPHFASFDLLMNEEGRKILQEYYENYIAISKPKCKGFILETGTWRANPDWIEKVGYSSLQIDTINSVAIQELEILRNKHETEDFKMPISLCIGPRGDGYSPKDKMSVEIAEEYHSHQIEIAAAANADMVSAMTMNYNEEAIGIVAAAKKNNIPVIISYTVETDGKLPSGDSLEDALTTLDKLTDNYVSYFMINCAHPNHFKDVLKTNGSWLYRIGGIRANSSTKSHAELDESEVLDEGDKDALAKGYKELKTMLPNLNVIGGCCGTDHTHMEKICEMWFQE
ncbi:MAG: homocysteine S-methyltransferase family protein [Eudoraea sp.]|uniref:homocysteine S-methyltransferase family protein n=1 Tax=Eudoraea sp. TaxID=1979955 RepID=UPI0032665482